MDLDLTLNYSQEQLDQFEKNKHLHADTNPPNAPPTNFDFNAPVFSRAIVINPQQDQNSGAVHSNVCCPMEEAHNTSPSSFRTNMTLPCAKVHLKVGVLTISDRASLGVYPDVSGPEAEACVQDYVNRNDRLSLEITCTRLVCILMHVIAIAF